MFLRACEQCVMIVRGISSFREGALLACMVSEETHRNLELDKLALCRGLFLYSCSWRREKLLHSTHLVRKHFTFGNVNKVERSSIKAEVNWSAQKTLDVGFKYAKGVFQCLTGW